MYTEWVPFVIVGVAALLIGVCVGYMPGLRAIQSCLIAGAALRLVGVLARHTMIFDFYDGGSDAVGYFSEGLELSKEFRALDFSVIGSGQAVNEWGTQAINYASGMVIALVGPSVRGAFLVFSVAGFLGLICTIVAVKRSNPNASLIWAASLLFLWPTLWFWPSSIGKEAVLLLAVGLVTVGYVGRANRIHWVPMVAGLLLALVIRPHVAGVLAIATCAAEWARRDWTANRVIQSVLTSALAILLVVYALQFMGLSNANADTMQEFVLERGYNTNQGGSAFGRSAGLANDIPMAFVNILCRPFITEAHSAMALMSSLETMAFWGIVILKRKILGAALRSWRTNRLLRFSIPFALLYVLMLGITFQNSGIIARQRTLVMPALIVIAAALPIMPISVSSRATATRRRRYWGDRTSVPPLAVAPTP